MKPRFTWPEKWGLGRLPRALVMFFATSLAGRGIGIICQLLQVPLIIAVLGPEAFGFWMTLTGLTSLVQFTDLGLGTGAQNRMSEQFAQDDSRAARVLFGSVFVCLAGVGLVLAAGLTLLVPRIDFTALFHLREAGTVAQAPGAALVLSWIFCAGFPLGLAQRLAFARQQGWMYNVAQAAGSVGALALVAWGTRAHWGLAGLVAAAQGAMLLGNAVLLAVQFRQLGWLDLRRFTFRPALVRGLLGLGALLSVQQVLSTVLFSLPPVIISAQLGAAAVTPYNLVQRLFNLFAVVQNAFLLPLWPAWSQARARGEFDWMRSALRHAVWATTLGCVLPMVLFACFASPIIRLWVGEAGVQPAAVLIWLLCAWNSLTFLQQPYLFLLVAVSEVRRTTLYCALSAAVSTALMFGLARPLGVPGVVLGLILGSLPFNFAGNVLAARRYLRTAPDLPAPAPLPAT
jgi:O-antigen/teichoic acid export membrane protein